MTATGRGPVIGTLLDQGGLVLLHGDDLQILARSLRLFASSLASRDGAVPAGVLVLLSALERAATSAAVAARLPTAEVLGSVGSVGVALTGIVVRMQIGEVAKRLGCGERNVRDLVARGAVPATKTGGRWTFHPVDVADLLESRRYA